MIFQKNQSLRAHNTFGLAANAALFSSFSSNQELEKLLAKAQKPLLVLGGGSNVLLSKDFEGTVLKNEIGGISIVREDSNSSWIQVGGGVVWHELVLWSIEQGLGGLENLSLIPGSVGAAPMQNIGAYGVELQDVFDSLEAIAIDSLELHTFKKEDCDFGYRYSAFKGPLKGQYIISSVCLKLAKRPAFNTAYGAIEAELSKMGVSEPSLKTVSQAVINIRQHKLPDPKDIGNSGSFFKNPVIPNNQFKALQERFPKIVGYTVSDKETKLAAGWLIEQAGWKGYRKGDAGVHQKQALVLVNYGGASGKELIQLSEKIQESVSKKFGISLEAEVNII